MFAPHTAERFQLDSRIGGGGMGEIYRATDMATQEIVAIKLLKRKAAPEEAARFMREVKVLAELRHPGIVRYVDHGIWPDKRPYLAMEWLEGEDLEQRERRQPIGMADAVEVVRRAAQAMAAIHARGVVHRDLKMSNIFVTGPTLTRGIKLIDFGVVKLPEPDEYPTLPGSIIGTPTFMAPEQARGGRVDARSDVYSLAAVLFRLVTGRNVFEADHMIAYLGRLVLEPAPLASSVRFDVPEPLDAVLEKALSRNPDERPSDAAQFARILARLPALSNAPPSADQSASAIRCVSPAPPQPAEPIDLATSASLPPAPPAARERRVVATMLASVPQATSLERTVDKVRAILGDDAKLELLQGGQLVAALGLERTMGDEAVRAARAALLIATTIPDARIAVATGHAVPGRRGLAGEALEHAAGQLERAAPGGIRIGKNTYALLQGRFVLRVDDHGALLLHEDVAGFASQRLLGVQTPTLGRDSELDLLMGTFRAVLEDGSPRGVVVVGATGTGKSRLRYEVLRRLQRLHQGLDVVMARGDPMLNRMGLSALGRAMRTRMGIRDGEPNSLQAERVLRYVGQRTSCPPECAGFLGELVGVVFHDEHFDALRTARETPQLMHARILQTLEAIIRHDATFVPQVLVIEDLHQVDETTVEIIDWLMGCRDLRIVVLAFGRPEATERFPDLWRKHAVTRIELGPLPLPACDQLSRLVLPDLPEPRRASILERAEGNALFLEELLRHAADGRDDVPLSVQALIQTRLDKLPPELRQVVRAASVFGRTCWTEGVSVLVGRDCAADLQALARAEVLERQESSRIEGHVEWCFPQNLVCETAYSSLLGRDRVALHRKISEWLLVAGEEDIGMIARHAEAGDDLPRAAVLYARASAQAYANGQLDAALELANKSVECGQDPLVHAQALLQKAQALSWLGHYDQQLEASEQAASYAQAGSDFWGEAQRLAGAALREQGRAADAESRLSWVRAQPCFETLGPGTRARIYAELTRAMLDNGRIKLAQEMAEAAVVAAEFEGDPTSQAMLRALDARSIAITYLGDFSASIDAARAVAQCADRAGDAVLATRARINLGFVLNRVGLFEEAHAELCRALSDARTLRMRAGEGFALHNLGMSMARLDDLDSGIEMEREAARIGEETGHLRLRLNALLYEAQMLTWRGAPGDLSAALESIEQTRQQSLPQPVTHMEALAVLGQVQLARRDTQASLLASEEALRRLETVGSMEEGEEFLRLTYVEVLLELGREQEAREALQQAYACVMNRASIMSDPEHRNAYLSRLYECVRLLDLVQMHLAIERPKAHSDRPPFVPRHSRPPQG